MKKIKEYLEGYFADTLKWEDIPDEFQSYFIIRIALSLIAIIGGVIFWAFTKLSNVFLLFLLVIVVYLAFIGLTYLNTIRNNVVIYTGTCKRTDINIKEYNSPLQKKPWITFYGKSEMLVKSDVSALNFVVPISALLKVQEGNHVRIYANVNEVYERDDNTYLINEPLLIKVSEVYED